MNHLRQSRGENLRTTIGVAVVYLKYNEPKQTVDTLLGSIAKQFIQDSNVLDQAARDLYEHHRQRNAAPPLKSIMLLLQKKLETYKETFLVIDGLDESSRQTPWYSPYGYLSYLSSIEEELESFVRIEIKANKMDIELFIDYQIQRNRNLRRMVMRNSKLTQDIKSAVVKTAESMFLLARLQVESLASAASLTKHVRQKLQELPTTLETSYDNAMQRIRNQEEDHRKLAFKTLAWVTDVFRSLSLRELQHALAVEPGDSKLDDELLMDAQSITALCAGLVVIDKATDKAILVHYSAKSYFENTRQKYFALYHAGITLSLATYLTLDALQSAAISEIAQHYPLATYAAQCLGDHARHSPEESLAPAILEAICHLLTDADKRKPLLTLLDGLDLIRSGYYSNPSADMAENTAGSMTSPPIDGATAASTVDSSAVGSDAVCSDLEGMSISSSTISGVTDDAVADHVTEAWQAKMRGRRIPEVTALHLAASMGLAKFASMLLKETPNIDAVDETGKTALTVAMERGFEKAVEFLIDGGALVQAQLNAGDTAADPQLRFMVAVYLGNMDEVALLSRTGCVEMDGSVVTIGNLALFLAVEHQDGAMVGALLDAGVNINVKDSKGQTALFRATRRQDAVMMKLLISDKIGIDSRDDEGRTAWSANVRSRNKEILDILLDAGADPSTRGLQGVSPLYEAASNGETELVHFLLESGTDPSIGLPRMVMKNVCSCLSTPAPMSMLGQTKASPHSTLQYRRTRPSSRAVRRAEMGEYPLQLDDFNFTDVLYHITCLRVDYQEFELELSVQTTLYNAIEQSKSPALSQRSSYRIHKDWTGNWKTTLAPYDTSYGYIALTPSSDTQLPLNGNSLNVPALGLGPLRDEESGESLSLLILYVAVFPNEYEPGNCYDNQSDPS
ncbi:hypothetical protein B0T26DRAFT_672672 [Lasiosphaeria miniovina]|uniref:Ankyrin repeat protein n=1 Tax=Lasiosphaeria miniovina TaxID=1954250 RepID=A0AA40B5H6_9PEZI|nr:uncharacterized protein B0T26DRAFT_672672 [Lasiosphaeria miniovina]KAK0728080.1 hypothetical protein B0T26DRAFT_672672 [Lasiosphaeria miniovina]